MRKWHEPVRIACFMPFVRRLWHELKKIYGFVPANKKRHNALKFQCVMSGINHFIFLRLSMAQTIGPKANTISRGIIKMPNVDWSDMP